MSNDNHPGIRRWLLRYQHVIPHKGDVLDGILLGVVGTLWHFLYGITDDTYLFGLIAPVNESLWEHGKLGLGATMVLLVVDGLRCHRRGESIPLVSRALGLITMNTFIIVVFLLYTSAISRNVLALDILLYHSACYVAVMIHRFTADRGFNSYRTVGILLWLLIITLYAIATPF